MKKLLVGLLGIQGSGKSNHSKAFSEANDFGVSLSTGDVIRSDDELSKIVADGSMVPDSKINPVLLNRLNGLLSLEEYKIILLDGYPRNLNQLEFLKSGFMFSGDVVTVFVKFEIERSVAVERMKLQEREDCTDAAIQKRLQLFDSETVPMIQTIENGDFELLTLNTSKPIEVVREVFSNYLNQTLDEINTLQPV